MKRTTKLATLAAGLVLAATALTGAAAANADSSLAPDRPGTTAENRDYTTIAELTAKLNSRLDSKSEDCVVSDPDDYNGDYWAAYTANEWGSGTFFEYDEKLEVQDWASDGHRTVVTLFHCYDGAFEHVDDYDSGPDQGDHDYEIYDLDFEDGRRIHFSTCYTNDNGLYNCGDGVYAVA